MTEIVRLPHKYDLTIKQGSDWQIALTITDANGTAKDLTGYTAKMQIREDFDSPVLLTLGTVSGGFSGITITAASGEVGIVMTNAQTAALPDTKLRYDVYIASAAPSTITYLLEGYINLSRRVTR